MVDGCVARFAHGGSASPDSARLRLQAALIRARWVNACGKFPSASPAGPISAANSIGSSHAITSGPSVGAQNILLMGRRAERWPCGNFLV